MRSLYVWSKQAFRPFAAFITGWSYWSANLPYLPGLLYFGAANALYIGGPKTDALSAGSAYFLAASLGGLGIADALNVVGLNVGKWMSNAGAVATWIPARLLILFGAYAWMRYGSATPFTAGALLPYGRLKDLSSYRGRCCSRCPLNNSRPRDCPSRPGLIISCLQLGRIHPRWHTPHVALLVQAGAAGIPFVFMFAAMFRLQREPAGSDVIRVPGGPGVARVLASLGFAVSVASIALACVPAESETNKLLAVSKVVGGSAVLVVIGVALYCAPRRPAH